jgi:hypothetical protein
MTSIKFTATIVWKGKGGYVARADELSIVVPATTTQRRAIRKLKDAVLARFRQAATEGKLAALLDDAGYHGDMIYRPETTLEDYAFNRETISVPLPHTLPMIDRAARRKRDNDDERNDV